MTEKIEEPTADEAGGMLLKVGALLGAGALCVQSTYKFLECLPTYSWFSAVGPITFAILSVLLAGRIVIWGFLRAYWVYIPNLWIRISVRGAIGIALVLAMLSTATVFSASLLPRADDECTMYTDFMPRFLPR